MDDLKKWMIIHFAPHQTTTLPKRMFSQIYVVQIILAATVNGLCAIQVRLLKNSDNLCLLFCLYPSSMGGIIQGGCYRMPLATLDTARHGEL